MQAEMNIHGYDIFSTNLAGTTGRSIMVYTASKLKAYAVNPSSNFEEHISLSIKLNNAISLIFTCVYRSRSSNATDNERLNDLIREIDNHHHPLKNTTGDFNFPSLSWDDLHCTASVPEVNNFKKAVLDCYWNQYVDFPTRAHGTDTHLAWTTSLPTPRNVSTTFPISALWEAATTLSSKQTSASHWKRRGKPMLNITIIKVITPASETMWGRKWVRYLNPKTSTSSGTILSPPQNKHRTCS